MLQNMLVRCFGLDPLLKLIVCFFQKQCAPHCEKSLGHRRDNAGKPVVFIHVYIFMDTISVACFFAGTGTNNRDHYTVQGQSLYNRAQRAQRSDTSRPEREKATVSSPIAWLWHQEQQKGTNLETIPLSPYTPSPYTLLRLTRHG